MSLTVWVWIEIRDPKDQVVDVEDGKKFLSRINFWLVFFGRNSIVFTGWSSSYHQAPRGLWKKNNIGEIYMDTCHIDRLNMSTEIGKFTCKNKDSFTSSNRNVTKQKKETTANIEILPSKDRD